MSINFSSLTSKQKKVYYAIESFIKEKGLPPTVREIGEMVGEKTPGAIQGILNRLEQKGVIKRETGMARSIRLVSDSSPYAKPVYVPEIKKVSIRNVYDLFNIYNIITYQPLPESFLHMGANHFLLACPDNSLMDSGITYQDMLVISPEYTLSDGDIVLVLYQNYVLLRHYYKHELQGMMTLKADSNLIDKEDFRTEEVIIIGKLIGKYTRF